MKEEIYKYYDIKRISSSNPVYKNLERRTPESASSPFFKAPTP